MLTDPARVAVTPPATTVERVEQRGVHVPRGEKPALLAATLRSEPVDRALIFTRTKRGADRVVQSLVRAGIEADAIHGNKSQGQRERVLAAFRDGSIRTLVATDIAARGIDVTGISHVINYDMPEVPEAYVHRIGRTARAGKEGIAISFCAPDELSSLRAIEKLIGLQILPSVPGERNLSPKAPRQARGAGKPRSENRPGRNRRPHSGGRQDSGRERGSRQERPQTHNPAELGQIPFLKPARRGDGSASRPGRSG
jgi:ATP-dependent RNA helicase RhlE